MNPTILPRLLLACALLSAGATASAAGVRAVLSSESGHYREAFAGFQEEWGATVPVSVASEAAPASSDIVVAFGSRAALRPWPGAPLVIACLAPGSPARTDAVRVSLLPDPSLLVARMKKLLPGLRVLRVLWSSAQEDVEVGELGDAAAAQGVRVISERIEDPAGLPDELRAIAAPADALWLMPDPVLVTAKNFAVLREYSAAARIPFLAPTEGLAEKGATATLAASFRDVGRAAALALKARERGERVHEPFHPVRIVVTVSGSAARAAGLDLKGSAEIDRTVP